MLSLSLCIASNHDMEWVPIDIMTSVIMRMMKTFRYEIVRWFPTLNMIFINFKWNCFRRGKGIIILSISLEWLVMSLNKGVTDLDYFKWKTLSDTFIIHFRIQDILNNLFLSWSSLRRWETFLCNLWAIG